MRGIIGRSDRRERSAPPGYPARAVPSQPFLRRRRSARRVPGATPSGRPGPRAPQPAATSRRGPDSVNDRWALVVRVRLCHRAPREASAPLGSFAAFAACRRAGASRAASLAVPARDVITPWGTPRSMNDGRVARASPPVEPNAKRVTRGLPARSQARAAPSLAAVGLLRPPLPVVSSRAEVDLDLESYE